MKTNGTATLTTQNLKSNVNHPLLSRLIEEIKHEKQEKIYAKYDRTHNRHNRGQ